MLVGDSLGMVVQGRENTLPVTLDQMIYHAEMVRRGAPSSLVVVDLPFPAQFLGTETLIANAARVLKESAAQAVKLESSAADAAAISALTAAGIPVMAHCGLHPQAVHQMGGYRVQRDEKQLLVDALAMGEGRRICVGSRVCSGCSGNGGQPSADDPHHRNRCRCRLRWPNSRDPRPIGDSGRECPEARQGLRGTRRTNRCSY